MYQQDDHTTSTVNSAQTNVTMWEPVLCLANAYRKDLEGYSTDGHNSDEKPASLALSQLDRTGHE